MSPKLPEMARHSVKVFALAVVIFGIATVLTYLEDGLKALHRPEWLQQGVAAISVGLFILDGILLLGMAGIATLHILVSLWKSSQE